MMADETTFSKEALDKAVADAIAATNTTRDEAEKGLKSKVDELLAESKAAKEAKNAADAAAQKAAEEAARKGGDTEALEASWQAKYDKLAADKDAEIAKLSGAVNGLTVESTAKTIGAELAIDGSAGIIERFARDRLTVEMTDNGPIVRVLDALGKPSASSVDDLKAEMKADAALAPVIRASNASGGGAANANGGAGKKKLSDMTATEEAQFANANPTEYAKMVAN